MKNILRISLILVLIYSCSDKGTDPKESDPIISFFPETMTIQNGGQAEIDLKIADFKTEIFAVSMQITFNQDILSFDENSGFRIGDFFGQSAVTFVKGHENKIHLTVSLLQGNQSLKGSGTAGSFTFGGKAAGSSTLEAEAAELIFYDESGNLLDVPDLSLVSSIINVN